MAPVGKGRGSFVGCIRNAKYLYTGALTYIISFLQQFHETTIPILAVQTEEEIGSERASESAKITHQVVWWFSASTCFLCLTVEHTACHLCSRSIPRDPLITLLRSLLSTLRVAQWLFLFQVSSDSISLHTHCYFCFLH